MFDSNKEHKPYRPKILINLKIAGTGVIQNTSVNDTNESSKTDETNETNEKE